MIEPDVAVRSCVHDDPAIGMDVVSNLEQWFEIQPHALQFGIAFGRTANEQLLYRVLHLSVGSKFGVSHLAPSNSATLDAPKLNVALHDQSLTKIRQPCHGMYT